MIKYIFLAIMMSLTIASTSVVFSGTATAAKCTESYFAIPTWYRGLMDSNCSIKPVVKESSDSKGYTIETYIMKIVLNILQALMVVAAYVTIFFITKGGFNYMTAAGQSDKMSSAKSTITNALIGLVIAILSASIVNMIAGAIK